MKISLETKSISTHLYVVLSSFISILSAYSGHAEVIYCIAFISGSIFLLYWYLLRRAGTNNQSNVVIKNYALINITNILTWSIVVIALIVAAIFISKAMHKPLIVALGLNAVLIMQATELVLRMTRPVEGRV